MKQTTIFIAIFSILILVACKKKDDNTDDTSTATPVVNIVIHEPLADSIYAYDSTVVIDVDMTADFEFHAYSSYLINTTTGDTVWETELEDHGDAFHLHDSWVNNVADTSQMTLEVHAEIDHDGHETVKTVNFVCHPM